MIKIKVQHQFSVFISILALIAILVISVCIGYFMFMTETDISSKTRSDIYALIGIFLFVIVPFIFTSIKNKTEYVSDIIISADYIELIYKEKQKETKRTRILKDDIEVFEAIVTINKVNSGKTSYIYCNSVVTIELKNRCQIQFLQNSSNQLWGSPYKFILDLIKNSIEIPNFKYQINGNYEFAKKDIENYSIYKKQLPFSEQLKYDYKSQPKIIKIIYLILIFILIGNLCFMGYLSMPAGKLTKEEQEYMKHYNQAYELRTKKNQYQEAINELNKAEDYFSNTAETYLDKAYCYNKLKEYDKAITVAKEGLKYIDSKSIYRKYHNFKFVVVVDDNVDVFDESKVLWSISTKVQADRDVIILPQQLGMGCTLDPSSDDLSRSSKMGIDATQPLSGFSTSIPTDYDARKKMKSLI